MMCEICGKVGARVRIRQIIGTECRELRLCEACAKERGIINGTGEGISDDVAWFLHGLFEEIPGKPVGVRSCPVCGTRLREIRSSRRVGCGSCYETFGREIRKILRLPEGEKAYRGKLPQRVLAYQTFFIDRENLKIQLEAALGSEDYEKAARLRDQILELDNAAGTGHKP